MDKEELYLQFIKELMKEENQSLYDSEEDIIKGILQKKTYDKIAKALNRNPEHIRKIMSKKVFPMLNQALRKRYKESRTLGKLNFVSIIKEYVNQNHQEESLRFLNDSVQNNNIKLRIIENIKAGLNTENIEKKESYAELIKIYWLELHQELSNKIDDKNLEELLELLINKETSVIINIFNSIIQDKRVEEDIKNWFKTIQNKIKQRLSVSKQDFQKWTDYPITPEQIDRNNNSITDNNLEHCLLLKIEKSDSKSVSSDQYAVEGAYFLPDISYPPTQDDYKSLHKEIQTYQNYKIEQKKDKEYYSIDELKPLLTQLIEISSKIPIKRRNVLTIYFFCEKELLSTNFDCWQCEFLGDDSKLKDLYQIRVRCIDRLDPGYLQTKCKKEWDNKWNLVKQQFNPSDEGKTWRNLCRSNSGDFNALFLKLLKFGIPIAIWSRYHQKFEDHSQEINNLVLNCEGNLHNLPEIIGDRRKIDSDDDDDIENLGHHLSLLWEDPNVIPPFDYLTS